MPALDVCHPQVVRALEKTGWSVKPEPYVLPIDRRHRVYIDIEAQHPAQAGIMVIEVKCFQDQSQETADLYGAIGQYLIYRNLLTQRGLAASLYLALPTHAYEGVVRRMALPVIVQNNVKMIVIDLMNEVIVQWLP